MSTTIDLSFMDLYTITPSLVTRTGVVFDGAVEPGKIDEACAALSKAWPVLAAYLHQNSETNKLEVVIPNPAGAKLKVISTVINSTLAESESLHTRTSRISTQATIRNNHLYQQQPPKSAEDYITSGDPMFDLHVTYLSDATILTLTYAHIFMDAAGYSEVVKALLTVMDGGEVPLLLPYDPWPRILPDALRSTSNPEFTRDWKTWGSDAARVYQEMEARDPVGNGPIQSRTIYFPAAEISRLKQEAEEELSRKGHEVMRLSTSDIIGAWIYKHMSMDDPDSEERHRFTYIINLRKRFPETFQSNYAYLHNAVFVECLEQLTPAQLHSITLGELARLIRLSVLKYTTRESLFSQLKWSYEHTGQTTMPFSPEDRLNFSTSWLLFGLGDLSIARHVKPGTGTGEVLDVMRGGTAKPRRCSYIKFKDVEGGVACEMDWDSKRWTTGTMARFALENLV